MFAVLCAMMVRPKMGHLVCADTRHAAAPVIVPGRDCVLGPQYTWEVYGRFWWEIINLAIWWYTM